jgi:ATP-dependent DNA ligase
VKSASGVALFSRRKKSLNKKFPYIVEALADLPPGTVVDGELVGLDDKGRPDFNLLQNFRGGASRIYYYIFDLLCCKDRDLTRLPLVERRALLKSLVTIRDKRIRISDYVKVGATELLAAVREQHLESFVGKAARQHLRAGEEKRRVDKTSRESRTGVRRSSPVKPSMSMASAGTLPARLGRGDDGSSIKPRWCVPPTRNRRTIRASWSPT